MVEIQTSAFPSDLLFAKGRFAPHHEQGRGVALRVMPPHVNRTAR